MNDDDKKPKDPKAADEADANIPVPHKFVIDQNEAIYKSGKDMPGELGKPVNVDKNVSYILLELVMSESRFLSIDWILSPGACTLMLSYNVL